MNLIPQYQEVKVEVSDYLQFYKAERCLVLPVELVDGPGKVEELEKKMLQEEQVKWHTKHFFSDGVYTRETFVPEGSLITGRRHRHKTVSVLVKGVITVVGVDEEGNATDHGTLEAPLTFVTEPNTKKVGYAHEDVIFINAFSLEGMPKELHNEVNLEAIEEFIFHKEKV